MIVNPNPESRNVAVYLKAMAEVSPDTKAIVLPGESVTFQELWNRVDRTGSAIRDAGIHPGDRIICMIPMSVNLYVIMLGILKIGAVAVFVDPWIGMKSIARFASYSEPVGFCGIPKAHILRLFNRRLAFLPFSLTTGKTLLGLPARYSLCTLMDFPGEGKIAPVEPDDTALITFTSGSSGTPKGANRTHGFLDAQHKALKKAFPYLPGDVDMSMFPVFVLNNLGQGIPTIVPDMDFKNTAGVSGERIYKQMMQHGVTTCTASPPFIQNLAEYLHHSNNALKLRRILTGGAPVQDAQLKLWSRVFKQSEIIVVYGSTEAEPVAHIHAGERLALSGNDDVIRGYCAGILPEPRSGQREQTHRS